MAHGLYLVPSACPKNLGKATFVQPDENAFRAVIGATANIATVSSIVGHFNPNITLGIYTHVNMDQQRMAMDAMQSVFD